MNYCKTKRAVAITERLVNAIKITFTLRLPFQTTDGILSVVLVSKQMYVCSRTHVVVACL